MRNSKEMLEGLAMYVNSPAYFLYPWILVLLVWKKNSGSKSDEIPFGVPASLAWMISNGSQPDQLLFDIPVDGLSNLSHPNEIPASLEWMKSSGSQSDQILFDIPVVRLYDFSHPNEIQGKDCPFAIDGERYYFTKQVHRDASGKRSKRKAGEQGAYWKSTSKDIEITDLKEKLIGYMRKYTLYEDKDDKTSSNWHMEEYMVHNHHELVEPYVLCKIYDKDSCCPRYTETSVRVLTKRIIERQLGSIPNPCQTQFVGSDSHEDILLHPNQFQTQFDGSDSPDDILLVEDIIVHPPSENIPPESILPTSGSPSDSNPMNQSQTHSDNNNLVENHIMEPTFPTSEYSSWHTSPSDSYCNEYHHMRMESPMGLQCPIIHSEI